MCSTCDELSTSSHIIYVTHCVCAFGIQSCVKCLKRVCLGAYGMAGFCNFAEKVCTLVHTVFTDVHMLLRCTHWTTLAVCIEVQHPAVSHYQIQRHHLIQWHSHNFIREELPWWFVVCFVGSKIMVPKCKSLIPLIKKYNSCKFHSALSLHRD